MPKRIIPTNGRVMLFHPCTAERSRPWGIAHAIVVQHDPGQPLKCDVCHVWGEDLVNVNVTDSNGAIHFRSSVPVVQEGSPHLPTDLNGYVTWMDYQLGQAEKHQELERQKAAEAAAVNELPRGEATPIGSSPVPLSSSTPAEAANG